MGIGQELLCKIGKHSYEVTGGETGYRHLECQNCGKLKREAR